MTTDDIVKLAIATATAAGLIGAGGVVGGNVEQSACKESMETVTDIVIYYSEKLAACEQGD